MLNRPSANLTVSSPSSQRVFESSLSFQTLQEIVSCFCAVVRGQTHDFTKMIVVLKACASEFALPRRSGPHQLICHPQVACKAKLRSSKIPRQLRVPTCACSRRSAIFPRYSASTATLTKSVALSLVCPYSSFELAQLTFSRLTETEAAINAITPRSMSDFLFQSLITLYNLPIGPAAQSGALTSLGFLYRAYPTFMLKPGSTKIMDAIFASPDLNAQIQLLRIFQDFLASQGRTAAPTDKVKAETGVKIAELVGNVDGFADSGSVLPLFLSR